jgi:hypothetical protein
MDGLGFSLERNLFLLEPQLEMDYCALAFVEGVVATTITIATTKLGKNSSTIETLVISLDLFEKN